MAAVAHATRGHAKLAPSSAHRWLACAGSIALSQGIESKSGIFADEGTAAHTLGELCLRENLDAVDFLGGHVNIRNGTVLRAEGVGDGIFAITDEMVDGVQLYVDTVRDMIEPGDDVEFEAKLDLTHIPGMEFGTGDALIYKVKQRRLVVADLKYGRGVVVEVAENPQLHLYAIGAAKRFHNRGIDTIEMVIVQPRAAHKDGPVRRQVIDATDLVETRMGIEGRAVRVLEANSTISAARHGGLLITQEEWDGIYLNPGDHCRFCPAAAICPALQKEALAVAEMEFSDEPPSVADMTPAQMVVVLAKADRIDMWATAVKRRAHDFATRGGELPGMKLVATKAFRRWRDADDAKFQLTSIVGIPEDDLYGAPKMISPAAVEKLIGRKRKSEIADLISSASSGTILVSVDDPRQPVRADAAAEFETEETGT